MTKREIKRWRVVSSTSLRLLRLGVYRNDSTLEVVIYLWYLSESKRLSVNSVNRFICILNEIHLVIDLFVTLMFRQTFVSLENWNHKSIFIIVSVNVRSNLIQCRGWPITCYEFLSIFRVLSNLFFPLKITSYAPNLVEGFRYSRNCGHWLSFSGNSVNRYQTFITQEYIWFLEIGIKSLESTYADLLFAVNIN